MRTTTDDSGTELTTLRTRIVELEAELARRERSERAFETLVAATANAVGEAYFPALVEHLAATLDVRDAFVSEFVGGDARARTRACWHAGTIAPNFEYAFSDPDVAPFESASSLGVILRDQSGRPIGHLCIADDRPCAAATRARTLLAIFGARAAGELEQLGSHAGMEFTQFAVDQISNPVFWIRSDGTFSYVNKAACRRLGYSRDELLRMTVADIDPDHPTTQWATHRARVRGAGWSTFESRHRTRSGEVFPVEVAVTMVKYGDDEFSCAFAQDITDRVRAEESLRTSEERFRLVALATRDAVHDWNLETDEIWRNHVYQQRYGARERMRGAEKWWERHLHPDDRDRLIANLDHFLARDGAHWADEYRLRRPDGTYATVVDRSFVKRDANGKPLRVIGAMTDVTERRRAEQSQRLMINELDHRVKNNLAAVLGLVEQTRGTARSLDEFILTFQGRVGAMARAHEALAAMRWKGVHLHDVVRLAVEPYVADDAERVTMFGASFVLPPRTSGPLSLTLHELATNAVKHGALSVPGGRIRFSATRGDDDLLRLEWSEHDGPPLPPALRSGVGTSLMRGFIEYELSGSLTLDTDGGVFRCRMVLPGHELPTTDPLHAGRENPA